MSTQTQEAPAATGSCCGSHSSCSSHGQSHGHSHHDHHHSTPEPLFQPQAPKQHVTDSSVSDAIVWLSEKAAIEVKRFISEKNVPADCVLRVALSAGGCSGFEPRLGFDNNVSEADDLISEQFGIRVAIDRKYVMFMQGTTIDYYDGIDRRGFKFDNPNATSSCGCGKSFSV